MWRVPGFVGRVWTRYHGNAPLRLTPPPHKDDVTSSTVLVPSSSQREEDGQKKRQRRFQFCNTEIPQYTAVDAVGWGAAAVIFMHMCRRIHSSFSSGSDVVPVGVSSPSSSSALQRCGYRLLLHTFCRRDVLPGGSTVLCLEGAAESQNTPGGSSSGEQRAEQSAEELSASDWTDGDGRATSNWTNRDGRETFDWTNGDSRGTSDWTDGDGETTQDNDEGAAAERLSEAAVNLSHVGDSSVPVILNIIGLQGVQRGDDEAAFACFHTGALRGYGKAQYNTAVCYETGRGTPRNHHKALYFYGQAAEGNHAQAQYRYAKLLLTSRGRHRSTEELKQAVSMLEKASASGLTQAQLLLATVLSEEPISDARRSVIYLQMAADQESSRAQLLLGQCYEKGVGVEHNLQTALRLYQQAAMGGSQRAKALLMSAGTREAALRSIRSAPCFQRAVQPGSLTSSLPHSWSTGNLSGNLYPYTPPPTPPRSSDITLGVG